MLPKSHLPTPALLLDLDLFETNLARMMARVQASGKQLRPHFKAHKCVEIARRQLAAGACGICAATVPEAELLAAAGIGGLLLTSPLADPLKMARAVATGAMVVVDHRQQVDWYSQVAVDAGRTVGVLVDLDVGDHRTGARSTAQALEIAQAIDVASGLELRGLQGYSVLGSHAGGFAQRQQVSQAAFAGVAETRAALAQAGLAAPIVTGGSTGTWEIDLALPEVTEIQAGSFVLMDLAYAREGLDFAHALTVMATVISANHEAFVTLDAGFKAFSTDRGYGPEPVGRTGFKYRWGGDEFGYLDRPAEAAALNLGERVEFIPPHCDPTVNLYDRIYACRGDVVEATWPVMQRWSAAG